MFRKVFLIFILFAAVVCAQENKENISNEEEPQSNLEFFKYVKKLTVKDYYTLLDDLKKEQDTTDYFLLRMAYTKTDSYDPYGTNDDESIKNCSKLLDAKKYEESIAPLDSILARNYVHIKAHMYLGYIYKKLNKAEKSDYHYRVYNGLVSSMMETGNGKDTNNAYIVINVNEEYMLLDRLGLTLVRQSLVKNELHTFDVMRVKEGKKSKEFDLYFNIDIPVKTIKNK